MPVTGNEEPGVLSLQYTNISAGIPLKKRRFLLVQPPSPPHQETPPSFPEENDAKKIEKYGSDVNNKEGSSLEFSKKEKSGSDLMNKQEPVSDIVRSGESCLDVNKKEESELESKRKEGSKSELNYNGESGIAMKNQVESSSEQMPQSVNVANSSTGTLDVGKNGLVVEKESLSDSNANPENLNADFSGTKCWEASPLTKLASVNKMEGETKLLLSEKSTNPDVPAVMCVKKEIHTKSGEDCNLKLCTGSESDELALQPKILLVPDKFDNSILALSLNNGKTVAKETSSDPRLGNVPNHACTDRSNWDLNTTMDAWEGSAGVAVSKVTIDMLSGLSGVSVPSVSSTPPNRNGTTKGKHVIEADEQGSGFSISAVQLSHSSEDTLHLTLSTYGRCSSAKVDSRMGASILNLPNAYISNVTANYPGSGVVKSEPIDVNSKNASTGATGSPMGLLECGSVKTEPVLRPDNGAVKVALNDPQKLIARKSVKLEPQLEVVPELSRTGERTLEQSVVKFVHCQESASSSSFVLPVPLTPQKLSPSRLVTSSELSASIDVSNLSEHSVHTNEVHTGNDSLDRNAADMVAKDVHKDREGKVSGHKLNTSKTAGNNVDSESGSKMMNENSNELRADGEGCASEEGKINFSVEMMEDESYGSECESNGNQAFTSNLNVQDRCARDDDDYEDGEVREAIVHSTVEDPPDGMDMESVKHIDPDIKDNPPFGFAGEGNLEPFHLADKDNELEVHDDKAINCKECVGTASNETNRQLTIKDGIQQIMQPEEIAARGVYEKSLVNPALRTFVDEYGKESVLKGDEKDILCETTRLDQKTMTTMGEAKGENVEFINMADKPDLSLPVVEGSLDGNDVAKDSVSGGNHSRIINLPRASVTSPCRKRSISDLSFSSQSGREKYSDLYGDRFHLRGNIDESDTDGPRRFIRERIQDHSFRNSTLNYMRGRGRFSGRLDASRSDWDRECEFAADSCIDDYQFTRNKRGSAMTDAELESNRYVVTPDGAALSSSRGRKPFNNDLPSFHHPRRLSPASRDGPTSRDLQLLRRIPRNISPSRRNDENGADLVGLRRDDKFIRALPDDSVDSGYNRPQSLYEGGDGQFTRGNRNISAMQRRGFPRVRSKSPVGPRTRSPGPWSSPRRRSPDGFNGMSQLTRHRSGNMYGLERMRSPDRSYFTEDMIARRRGSPSYITRVSNDTRDMDCLREHGHPRSINSNRSPSDRVFTGSTRRLDVLDPRIRTSEDEFFGRPVNFNGFHEFHGDGNRDDRRKNDDRRGLIRPFRSPYASNGDNVRFHKDNGQRPFRFCLEGDNEFVGRSMREREFEGRIKNRPLVGTRRIRYIDEQEGNYRHNSQVWHDDGLNEASGFKKRRF